MRAFFITVVTIFIEARLVLQSREKPTMKETFMDQIRKLKIASRESLIELGQNMGPTSRNVHFQNQDKDEDGYHIRNVMPD